MRGTIYRMLKRRPPAPELGREGTTIVEVEIHDLRDGPVRVERPSRRFWFETLTASAIAFAVVVAGLASVAVGLYLAVFRSEPLVQAGGGAVFIAAGLGALVKGLRHWSRMIKK